MKKHIMFQNTKPQFIILAIKQGIIFLKHLE